MSNHFNDDDYNENEVKPASLAETIAALQLVDEETDSFLPSDVIYRLANINDDMDEFVVTWNQLPATRRSWVMRILGELSETDYMIAFPAMGYLGLEDESPQVRANAISVLWYDDGVEFFDILMDMAQDENPFVRTAAIQGLGRFIQAGELLEFDAELAKKAQALAVENFRNPNEDFQVRRRSLESLSHASHPSLADMIREGYYADDDEMKASAVYAMGASFDEQWSSFVLQELHSEVPEILFEAINAAGALQLDEAISHLYDLSLEDDAELQLAAIYALGEIANERAQTALGELAEALPEEEEDLQEAIGDALQEAHMLGSLMPFLDALDEMADELDNIDPDDLSGHLGANYLN